jgi:hypothetical protein
VESPAAKALKIRDEVGDVIEPAQLLRESLYRVDTEQAQIRTLRYVGCGVYPLRDDLELQLTVWQDPYSGEVVFLNPEEIKGASLIGRPDE